IPVTVISDKIMILDSVYLSVNPGDASICKGETVVLEAESNYDEYLTWSPDYALAPSQHAAVVFARPDTSVSYMATIDIPWSGCAIEKATTDIYILNQEMVIGLEYKTYSEPVC